MEDQQTSNRTELWSLSVKDLFYKYVRYLPLFLLSLAFALLVAWVYLRYSTRIYGAAGTLLIKNEQQSARNDKVEELLSGNNKSQNILNEIEILRSIPVMDRVVKRLHLQLSYIAIGKIKEINVYKQGPFLMDVLEVADSSATFSNKIKFVNSQQFRVNNQSGNFTFGDLFRNSYGVFRLVRTATNPPAPGSEFTVTWKPSISVAGEFVGNLKVQPKTPGTGMLSISIQTTNPEMGADIVNSLMVQYDSMTVEKTNYSTDQMINFIDDRLDILNKELDSIQQIMLAYQQRNNLIDVESQSTAYLERMEEANKAVNEQILRMNIAEMVEAYLKDKRNEYNKVVVPSSLGLEDPVLNELVATYNKAQLDRQSLIDGHVPITNPLIREAESMIVKLRESLVENLGNIKSAIANVIAELNKRSAGQQSKLEVLPYKLKEYVEIQRQVNTKLALKTLLEAKREEAAVTRASTVSNSTVVNKASPSITPVKPNRKMIQIIAVLLGLGLPALLIFIGEVINDKVSTRFDIERITKAPILGEVGHSYSDRTLVVNKTSRSMVAEQFRIVRSNLQYILPKIEKPVILITSSVSGEGKSFVSINMGSVIALAGKKTIILEFDIRKPKVLSGLGMSKKSGVSNFLVGKAELEDLVVPVPDQPNLWVLPCGPIPPNPSELLLDPKVTEMFDWLRDHYDVIFIDTAPVGMVSDAMTLGKFADCTLYLVRQGHTFKKQITLIDEFYQEKKLPRVSIIINDVKLKPGYGYYGYGRYGYGYGYGQKSTYYEEEVAPNNKFERFLLKMDPRKWFGFKK
jgi:capsular exopolysaccharide synthesis family protein